VLIATPQHLHCEHFVAALDAGKHVYQEKTMAFTVEHAKKMRAAWQRAGKRTVQIGHQWSPAGQIPDAASFLKPELMGKITAIHGHMYRNTPHGKPQWSRPVYPDMTPENILWKIVPGRGAGRRFRRQPLHQLALLLGLLRRQRLREHVPPAFLLVQGAGSQDSPRRHHDRRHLPVEGRPRSARHHERLHGARRGDCCYTWDSGFGNDQLRVTEDVLGDNGTISTASRSLYPQKVNRKDGNEMMGATRAAMPKAHMQNFLDSIAAARSPTARSKSASAFPSPAAWRWKANPRDYLKKERKSWD
jgi:hypothetical protein